MTLRVWPARRIGAAPGRLGLRAGEIGAGVLDAPRISALCCLLSCKPTCALSFEVENGTVMTQFAPVELSLSGFS